jgi:hypothetical protein
MLERAATRLPDAELTGDCDDVELISEPCLADLQLLNVGRTIARVPQFVVTRGRRSRA